MLDIFIINDESILQINSLISNYRPPLHYSRRLLNRKRRKSSIITKKISQKKVRGVMEKRTFINVQFWKIPLRKKGKNRENPFQSIMQ
jgi:hypothetical protein